MNEYFESIITRFNKIADVYVDELDKGKLIIRIDEAIAIVHDTQDNYNEHLWNSLWKGQYPESKYGESSRPVLVRYKNETSDPKVCRYNFNRNNFVLDDNDITESVKEWCEIPGYGYYGD